MNRTGDYTRRLAPMWRYGLPGGRARGTIARYSLPGLPMNRSLRYQISTALVTTFAPLLFVVPVHAASKAPAGATAVLAVLETSDLHANVVGYDYYKLAAEPSIGVDRTATLIRAARKEFANTLLLDNGDTIQGTAFADYQALVKPPACNEVLGIYKIMNALGYEGGTVGNHEFNYGLPFLNRITGSQFQVKGVDKGPRCAGPAFPIVLANVNSLQTKAPLFAPYRIIDKKITARGPDGKPVETLVKVGIIGFTPPDIMAWDKRWLEGRVVTAGVRETAEKYIPEMRKKGAQLIVALSHGGLDDAPYSPAMENANWHLAKVPGIDVMLMGHAHQLFPRRQHGPAIQPAGRGQGARAGARRADRDAEPVGQASGRGPAAPGL